LNLFLAWFLLCVFVWRLDLGHEARPRVVFWDLGSITWMILDVSCFFMFVS
jgi:hypothetical protein